VEIKKSISIVIPNYNGSHLLKEYLPYTLAAIKNAGVNYEIIIVDDCSTDGSVEFIKSDYSFIKLIVNSEYKGFSYSYNQGITAAQFELILLLNSDVKLSPDYFEYQWKYFTRWDTFGVMGRIVDMKGEHIQDAARVPKFDGFKIKTDYFYYTNKENDRLYTFYLSGSNALIDAAKLKQIGGFYELFSPFCYGDMELSIRAWRLNWKCYYEHKSVCRRELSTSTNYETVKNEDVYYRNMNYLQAIHLNGSALTAWYFQIALTDLLPDLLAGRTRIWKSYKELFINREVIKQYNETVENLLKDKENNGTIFHMVNRIRLSVKNKRPILFKP
jgi:GT2 family glycosyltransferase